ncbi:OmpA family protein [Cronobacter dublinensis]|uniref:OmpA family protein n=1 Tax=Cronobacter dublinensis TaxID=413497 RepID=UPI0024AEFC64|nr:OmpA family protein [Cronobacter dublinensis]MDI7492450.1 OmpA family protein [Cronobacter dublinensis]
MGLLNSGIVHVLTGIIALAAFSATLVITGNAALNNACAGAALIAGLFFISQRVARASKQTCSPPVANRELVIFIVGPFAARWFTRSGIGAELRAEQQTLWLLAATAEELQARLKPVRLRHPQADIRLWLPLLPDGYEEATLIAEQLDAWQRSMASCCWPQAFPCCVAFYARLSNTDAVYWAGLSAITPWSDAQAPDPFGPLKATFTAMQTAQEMTARQRGIMGQRLLRWAEATSLNAVLLSFMAHPALRLSGIVVADDGKGFTRHGAWARWLETQYGVLPPLSPALLLPPLPEALEAPRFLPVRQKTARAAGLLLSGVAFILLAASLLNAFWHARAQIRQTTSLTKNLTAVEPWNVSAQRTALSTLEAQHQRLARCAVSPQLTNWGLSPCARLARETQAVIERYRDLPYFSSQAPVSLFSSGSARLRAHSPAALAPLLAIIRQHPARHFLIIGHSDNTGSTEVNRQLSLERAVAVREWLMKEASLPATQFAIYGLGDSMPVAGNDTETGKALNRRVEVIALPVDPAQNKEIQQ